LNRALTIALALALAGLCSLCVIQWRREADFRAAIGSLTEQHRAGMKARAKLEQKLAALESEIRRLSGLRDDAEARFLAAHDDLRLLRQDWTARADTIQALSELAAGAAADPAALTAQNAAITAQNEMLRKLAAERDAAIHQLNARTREFNSLTEKYNKLAGRK
jgi:hypothetical protein